MESNFNNRDFEQFVKQNADQYRMFPSEKVWKGIHNTLHTRRRWYGVGLGLLILTVSTVTWVMLAPSGNKQTSAYNRVNTAIPNNKTTGQQIIPTGSIPVQTIAGKNEFPFVENIQKPDLVSSITLNNSFALKTTESITSPTLQNKSNSRVDNTYKPLDFSITDQATDNNITDRDLFSFKTFTPDHKDHYPLSIESVVNLFNRKNKRFSLQLYFTPTVSYRKLTENKPYLQSTQFNSSQIRFAASDKDINNVVTHKPALGFELGMSAGYQLSENLKIKAGLQFNVSRYDIKAFSSSGEIATIALNRGNDSISAWTNYRNFDGYKSDWLQNLYFSISAPVGIELKIVGDNKTSLGISGTLQPTYIIGDRAFLISSDYKNYAEIPSLIRRWNLNTSIEPYVGYSTGKLSWQIGPQVRYQLLSSYQKKYPVRENLFDFGLKVGVMLNH